MGIQHMFQVDRYTLGADRRYDPDRHLWVLLVEPDRARVGYDPLGRETAGDIVALSLAEPGTRVARGGELGTVEAAKFVGPLTSPLTGTVLACNEMVLFSPGLLNDDPLEHWLVEIAIEDPAELDELLEGETAVAAWFAAEVERFRAQGAIAE